MNFLDHYIPENGGGTVAPDIVDVVGVEYIAHRTTVLNGSMVISGLKTAQKKIIKLDCSVIGLSVSYP